MQRELSGKIILLISILYLSGCVDTPPKGYEQVNLFAGTEGNGRWDPGPRWPWGTVQLVPCTTSPLYLSEASPVYRFSDPSHYGLLLGSTYQHLVTPEHYPLFLPTTDLPYPHWDSLRTYISDQSATPGYYSYKLDGDSVRVAAAVSASGATLEVVYPGETANLALAWSENPSCQWKKLNDSLLYYQVNHAIDTLYFVMQFDHRFNSVMQWSGMDSIQIEGMVMQFQFKPSSRLRIRLGISGHSVEAAILELEKQAWEVKQALTRVKNAWNEKLFDQITLKPGEAATNKTYYTALYHASVFPGISKPEVNASTDLLSITEYLPQLMSFWDLYQPSMKKDFARLGTHQLHKVEAHLQNRLFRLKALRLAGQLLPLANAQQTQRLKIFCSRISKTYPSLNELAFHNDQSERLSLLDSLISLVQVHEFIKKFSGLECLPASQQYWGQAKRRLSNALANPLLHRPITGDSAKEPGLWKSVGQVYFGDRGYVTPLDLMEFHFPYQFYTLLPAHDDDKRKRAFIRLLDRHGLVNRMDIQPDRFKKYLNMKPYGDRPSLLAHQWLRGWTTAPNETGKVADQYGAFSASLVCMMSGLIPLGKSQFYTMGIPAFNSISIAHAEATLIIDDARSNKNVFRIDTVTSGNIHAGVPPVLDIRDVQQAVEGLMVGAFIGDALGGPLEFQNKEPPEWTDTTLNDSLLLHMDTTLKLMAYPYPAAPFGPWVDYGPAGTITDDSRWKLIYLGMLQQTREHRPGHFLRAAEDFIHSVHPKFKGLANAWYQEYAYSLRASLDGHDLLPVDRLWGGTPTLMGQMAFLPAAAIVPERPENVYLMAWQVNPFDRTVARDLNSTLVAGLAAACWPEGSWSHIEYTMRHTDPYHYGSVPWVTRRVDNWLDSAHSFALQSEGNLNKLYQLLESRTEVRQWWETWMPLVVVFSIAEVTDYQPLAAMHAVIAFGHDTDSYAQLMGAFMGALHGHEIFPSSWQNSVKQELFNQYGVDFNQLVGILLTANKNYHNE